MLIGEVWLEDRERFARYLRPDELHSAFNFDFLPARGTPRRCAPASTSRSPATPRSGAPTWVLSNHDVTRAVTRYGREDTTFSFAAKRCGTPTDLDLGRRRARAAALLVAALPGSLYLYQGEELGLPEVEDCRPSSSRIRCTSSRAASTRAATAAACRCRGRDRPAVRLQPRRDGTVAVAAPAGDVGRADRAGAGGRPGLDAHALPPASPCAASDSLGDGRSPGSTADRRSCFQRGDDLVTSSTSAAPIRPPDRVLLSPAPASTARLPPDTGGWIDPADREAAHHDRTAPPHPEQ